MVSILIIYFFCLFSLFINLSYELYCRCECCFGEGCTRVHLDTIIINDCAFCSPLCQANYPHLCNPKYGSYKRSVRCEVNEPGPIEDRKSNQEWFDISSNFNQNVPSEK